VYAKKKKKNYTKKSIIFEWIEEFIDVSSKFIRLFSFK
jgi:hypothetical protein